MKIRIGTRKSKLAMIQTELVRDAILAKFPDIEIELVPMSTRGDKILDRSLTSFGGKGVFTKELEDALLSGAVDLAVHSAKDMPMEFPAGLGIRAVLPRANAGDVLITASGITASKLPAGSVIGTSSLRRELQIHQLNPEVRIKLLRGNVQTRLDKLRRGEYDGILLAAAGLERLGLTEMEGLHLEYLDMETFIPAPGQGIMAVEGRIGELEAVMMAIHSKETAAMLTAERTYLTLLGGGCNAPCGAYCRNENGQLVMDVMYAADAKHSRYRSGSRTLAAAGTSAKEMTAEEAVELAEQAKELARRLAEQVKYKTVSLVGAGPGDASLLTRKGLECIRKADVIIYDNLISGSLLNEARLDAELIYAGKRSSKHYLTQDQINACLVEKALAGNYVVRLKGGDPYIFGRGGEEALELKKHGISFEVVPGVSSCYSVPAYAGIPVTHRNVASSFHVITGHEGVGKKTEVLDYATLAKEEGTLIFLMGLKNLGKIVGQLTRHGKPATTMAAVIQYGTTARQRKAVAPMNEIEAEVKRQGIHTPAILLIGDVVSLEHELEWFANGPLAGKRVLVTGSRQVVKEIEAELTPLGAETLAISLIESKAIHSELLKQKLQEVEAYTWMVFTSANGVHLFFETLNELEVDLRRLAHLKFAVVGKKTGGALRKHGFQYDFAPECFTGANLAKEWLPTLTKQDRVLLLRAKEGNPALSEALLQTAILFDDIMVYENWVDERRQPELNRAVQDVDYVVFASGSAAKAFAGLVDEKHLGAAKLISIGPTTTEAATQAGLPITKSASVYTAAGIASALLADVQNDVKV